MDDADCYEFFFSRNGNSMACAGTRQDPKNGLVGGHAYTVLGVADGDNPVPKLIKLRNPWGEQNYSGPWSSSWLESQGRKKEMDLLYNTYTDDFWMPFYDFTKVCKNFTYYKKKKHKIYLGVLKYLHVSRPWPRFS